MSKRMDKVVSATLIAAILATSSAYITGCGMTSSAAFSDGYINISADKEGMRAFGDTLNGMITNGKASPDKDTSHWITRRDQEIQTSRRQAEGFWQKLVNSNEKEG